MIRKGIRRLSPDRKRRIWRALLKKYGPYCQWCRGEIDMTIADIHDPMHRSVDHIVPWAEGGTNAITNLQPMHVRCNEEKAKWS